MALWKSALTLDLLRPMLADSYGLHLNSMKPLELGSANCFQLACEEGVFFAKEYQLEYGADAVEAEAKLVNFLKGEHFPVAGFLLTKDGSAYITIGRHVVSVQEYIAGQSFLNDMPKRYMADCAHYLGKLHVLLRDYPMEASLDDEWLASVSLQASTAKLDALLSALEGQMDDPHYQTIRDDLLFKKELAGKTEVMKSYYDGITYTPSHGDYTACQLICDDAHVKAVIDFTAARKLPAVWEIMRSYVQSFSVCQNGAPFNIDEFCTYVREYLKVALLTRRDLESMPYVYLVQLSQSSYGYKEYLVLHTANADALLRFATWRTGVCREIYKKAADISAALQKLV